jgi:molybdopterin-containing oxidoreductase family membrane subunit
MILAPSLAKNHAPYGWGIKWPSLLEMLITLGAFAWFTLLFLIFVKIFPSVSMYEIKEMLFEHREVSERLVREAPTRPTGEPRGQTA